MPALVGYRFGGATEGVFSAGGRIVSADQLCRTPRGEENPGEGPEKLRGILRNGSRLEEIFELGSDQAAGPFTIGLRTEQAVQLPFQRRDRAADGIADSGPDQLRRCGAEKFDISDYSGGRSQSGDLLRRNLR